MPRLTFTAVSGQQTIGPLAAATDFQVRDGSCVFTTEAAQPDTDYGFLRRVGDVWQVGAGKTVRLTTPRGCTLHYEALA